MILAAAKGRRLNELEELWAGEVMVEILERLGTRLEWFLGSLL
jgi:hypothetical protein